jgi:hypothetical protein
MIYTDGSGYLGNIGAATILYNNRVKQGELCFQLGQSEQHMVYEGELTAIILGLHLIWKIIN